MTGHVQGDSVQYDANGEWALNHRFLRIRMKDINSPPGYAAHVYIGYDQEDQEYVALVRLFGGRALKNAWVRPAGGKCDRVHVRLSGRAVPDHI